MKCPKCGTPMEKTDLKHTTYVGPAKFAFYCPNKQCKQSH